MTATGTVTFACSLRTTGRRNTITPYESVTNSVGKDATTQNSISYLQLHPFLEMFVSDNTSVEAERPRCKRCEHTITYVANVETV